MSSSQTKGLKRDTIDKFYTNNNAVNLCINNIINHLSISKDDLIIEPSAGNGSFIDKIKSLSNNWLFYDLEPENKEIIKQDYLELNVADFKKQCSQLPNTKIHLIGNPPFGRQSSLAIKFIKKSCAFCESISFILPKSFKKDSLKKHFPLNFHLICEIELPNKSFLVNNVEYNVESIFQIWEKKNYNREIIKKIESTKFNFVKKTENPDISFRRVGVYAGKIDISILDKSEQSHYFIKFTNNKSKEENIDNLNKIKFEGNNTVGPKSISKQELIKEFIKIL